MNLAELAVLVCWSVWHLALTPPAASPAAHHPRRGSVVASARLRLHGSVGARRYPADWADYARPAGSDRFVLPSGADGTADPRTPPLPPVGARPAGGVVRPCELVQVARGIG